MQITIQKLSREERDEFFRKNKWLIHRLWGIRVCFPDMDGDDDSDDDDQDTVILQKHSSQKQNTGHEAPEQLSQQEIEEELEELEEEIEEALEDIEEDLDEMMADGSLDEAEEEFVEELGEAIDELQEALEDHDASPESDNDKPDDLTKINGLGPKTAEGLLEAGITSFKQIAELSKKEIEALDDKVRNFAASYERKKFKKQAKDLL